MQITVKDIDGQQVTLEVQETKTLSDLLDILREKYEFEQCRCIVEGSAVPETTVIGTLPYHVIRLTTKLVDMPEYTYDWSQIFKALKGHQNTMIFLLHDLAQREPYILSYLASNPNMVCQYIETQSKDPSFRITARGSKNPYQQAIDKYDSDLDSLIDDLVESSGEDDDYFAGQTAVNPYIVDRDNVNRLLTAASLPESEFQRVKDMYLFFDRNFQQTLSYIRNS